MPSIQEIKRRIKSVTSTRQITKAMELVSATKMRKSQEIALLSRPYAIEALRILGELTLRTNYVPAIMQPRKASPRGEGREIKKTAVVLAASDRGLAGSFNANVIRAFERWQETERHATRDKRQGNDYVYVAVGKKAEEAFARKGITPVASFKRFGDYIKQEEVKPLTKLLVEGYGAGKWDRVVMISTHFRTTLRQEVMVREMLPISAKEVRRAVKEIVPEYGRFAGTNGVDGTAPSPVLDFEYLIEPHAQQVLDMLAPKLVEIALYDVILEANASEHSARMVAMKNASENAEELNNDLTILYNKSRQANITREINEIVSGAEALT